MLQQQSRDSSPSYMFVVLVACAAIFLTTLDVTIVNISLPSIKADIGASTASLQWIVDVYTLTFAGLMLTSGAIADRLGSNRVFSVGLVIFGLGSLCCGLADSMPQLLAARILQGVGSAALLPSSLAILRHDIDDPERRSRAIGTWAAGGAVSLSAGPVLGGVVTELLSWQYIFFLNIPFVVLSLVVSLRLKPSPRTYKRIDWIGQVCFVLAAIGVTYSVIQVGEDKRVSPDSAVLLGASVVMAVLFVLHERRFRDPVLPPSLLTNAAFNGSVLSGVFLNIANFGFLFVFGIVLQQIFGYSPFVSGLLFLPMTLTLGFTNLQVGRLSKRWSETRLIGAGLLLEVVGFIGIIPSIQEHSTVLLAVSTVPMGIGAGIAAPCLNSVMINNVDSSLSGVASGALNSLRQIGSALGVALFGAIMYAMDSLETGFSVASGMAIVVLVTATFISWWVFRGHEQPTAQAARSAASRA